MNPIFLCVIATTACLALGYVTLGVIGLGVGLLTLVSWLLAYKRPSLWPPLAALLLAIGLAGGGIFAGVSAWLMLFSVTASLASWDLMRLAHILENSPSARSTLTAYYNSHYARLGLALGLSMLIMIVGRLLPLQIPFWGVVLLVLLALFAFDRAWRTMSS